MSKTKAKSKSKAKNKANSAATPTSTPSVAANAEFSTSTATATATSDSLLTKSVPTESEDVGVEIHDYEKNQTVLMKWYHHNKDKAWFWRSIIAAAIIPIVLVFGWSVWGGRESSSSEAWREIANASSKKTIELETVAEKYDNQTASIWAWLQIGDRHLNDGVNSLPSNRDAAEGSLEKALEAYKNVADKAPADSLLARLGQFGVARSLESQAKLKDAVAAYRKVADNSKWKDTPESRRAVDLIALLQKPETEKFYLDLYSYKPITPSDLVTTPPSPNAPTAPELILPPNSNATTPATTPNPPEKKAELPDDPFATPAADSKKDAPKS